MKNSFLSQKHPWIYIKIIPIGGTEGVGFHSPSDLLLICSGAGRGVIDCLQGKVIARDSIEYSPSSKVEGIGPLQHLIIDIFSAQEKQEFANYLQAQHWDIIHDARNSSFLIPPNSKSPDDAICIWSNRDSATSLVAYAISNSTNYIAIATSSEIFLFAKMADVNSSYIINDNDHSKIKFVR